MPEVSRRTVMTVGAGGIGLAAVAVATQAGPAFAGGTSAASAFSALSAATGLATGPLPVRSIYAPAIGRTFRANDGTRSFDLTLTEIHDLPESTVDNDENRFGLLFTATGFLAGDGIFALRCAGVRTTTLFLTAVGPRGATRTLQAIVDRTA